MRPKQDFTLAVFYCQNTPGGSGEERLTLERKYGDSLRLFPLPCSGRMEPLHLLRGLEEFADAAYLVACPEGGCRYSEGNLRAGKRVGRAGEILESIGLEKERVGVVFRAKGDPRNLPALVDEIMKRTRTLGPSPVFTSNPPRNAGKGRSKKRPPGAGSAREFSGPQAEATAQTEQR